MNVVCIDVMLYIYNISIDGVNWLWLLSIFAGLWIWVVSSIGEVLSIFFLTFEVNYIIIHIQLCRCVNQSWSLTYGRS